jgi:itaconyl-CoA hydratase
MQYAVLPVSFRLEVGHAACDAHPALEQKDAMSKDFRTLAKLRPRGHLYEDFHVGQEFVHHWGRTITESDTIAFSTLTLSFNPLYFNAEYARAHGHESIVVNPLLVFNVVLGLSVEDCSEIGGPFVGLGKLTYRKPVFPGDTLYSRSRTVACRVSASNPANGIVTWHTEGRNQHDDLVVDFERSNLVRLRAPKGR